MSLLPAENWKEVVRYIVKENRHKYAATCKAWQRLVRSHSKIVLDYEKAHCQAQRCANVVKMTELSPARWTNILHTLPNTREVQLVLSRPPLHTRRNVDLYREVLAKVSLTLAMNVQLRFETELWVFGLAFSELTLVILLPLDQQLLVLESIHPAIKLLCLSFRAPSPQVPELIERRFKKLERLQLFYVAPNRTTRLLPCLKSETNVQLMFFKSRRIPLLNTTEPFSYGKVLFLERVAFHPDVEKLKACLGPHTKGLRVVHCPVSRRMIDLHFPNLTLFDLTIPTSDFQGWSNASGLAHLRVLDLELPANCTYPTAEGTYPRVVELKLTNVSHPTAEMWRWIATNFVNLFTLSLRTKELKDQVYPCSPLPGGPHTLMRFICNIHFPVDFFMGFASFASNLREIVIPSKAYQEYEEVRDNYQPTFEVFGE